jgi:hypothetical protein
MWRFGRRCNNENCSILDFLSPRTFPEFSSFSIYFSRAESGFQVLFLYGKSVVAWGPPVSLSVATCHAPIGCQGSALLSHASRDKMKPVPSGVVLTRHRLLRRSLCSSCRRCSRWDPTSNAGELPTLCVASPHVEYSPGKPSVARGARSSRTRASAPLRLPIASRRRLPSAAEAIIHRCHLLELRECTVESPDPLDANVATAVELAARPCAAAGSRLRWAPRLPVCQIGLPASSATSLTHRRPPRAAARWQQPSRRQAMGWSPAPLPLFGRWATSPRVAGPAISAQRISVPYYFSCQFCLKQFKFQTFWNS